MKFCISLAFNPLGDYCTLARAAEDAGFDTLAVSDHLVHPEKLRTPYPYTADGQPRWEPFTSWPDPWVAVGAMAAVTERLRFYSSVYVLPLRNPIPVAKAVGTAAVLSQNRVALGAGVGWCKDEFELLGEDFHTRGRRTNEAIEVLRKLWGGGWVEHHGDFYDFDRLEMSPAPTEPVPIYVGGLSEPALRRAARLGDGWISDLHTIEELREIIAKLDTLREEYGRTGDPFAIAVACTNAAGVDGYKRLADLGVTHLMTFPWMFYGGEPWSLQDKLDGVRRFGDDFIARM